MQVDVDADTGIEGTDGGKSGGECAWIPMGMDVIGFGCHWVWMPLGLGVIGCRCRWVWDGGGCG